MVTADYLETNAGEKENRCGLIYHTSRECFRKKIVYMNKGMANKETSIAKFEPRLIEVVVLDVDDTLTRGTTGMKIEAWEELFSDQLYALAEARELYEKTGKGDRYNIIAHIIGEPQEGCQENERVTGWADRFEALVQEKIRENGIHPDNLKAIKELKKKFPGKIYLLSATPQISLENNINYFIHAYPELESAFKDIIGTPFTDGKAGALHDIAEKNGLEPHRIVMVGDGGSDHNGANGAGTQFIGIVPEGREDKWENENFPKLQSIAELPPLLGIHSLDSSKKVKTPPVCRRGTPEG